MGQTAKNSNLRKARTVKNDEFYTRLSDIEKELKHYSTHFKGKTVYCNCDDPKISAFWRYFHINFSALGLEKLFSTHYVANGISYIMEYTGGNDFDISIGVKHPLEQDGDFRSIECQVLIDQCDIVVSNPPFSLFSEYITTLLQHNKKFLIVGSKNSVALPEVFLSLKENKMWMGVNRISTFITPSGEEKHFGNIGWYTNLETAKRHQPLALTKHYDPALYPRYGNYDAINVNRIADIPCDYFGIMGVPVTFWEVYDPEQFEVITLGANRKLFTPTKHYEDLVRYDPDGKTMRNHIACNQCLTIEYDEKPNTIYCRASNSDKYLVVPYRRILIRRKQ